MTVPRALAHATVVVTLLSAVPAPGAPAALDRDAALRAAVEARGRRVVEAMNSGDAALHLQAVRELFAPAALEGDGERRLAGLVARLHERLGDVRLHHAEVVVWNEPPAMRASLHVYVRSGADGGWKDLQFTLEPSPPHRLETFAFLADVAEPVYLPNGRVTDPATLAWLDGYVDRLVRDEDLAGGLLIAQGDRVIFRRTFGFADSARRRALRAETRFNLGSGGKMFTALALATLVEEGRLGYGDTLARLLPELADRPFARSTTLGHLLSHTSGVGEYWTEAYERRRGEVRGLRDFLPFVLEAGTRFAPGERFEYSNSNFVLAGLVLEAVAGTNYDAAVRARVLAPCGMTSTGNDPFDDADTSQAQPLARGPRGWSVAPHGVRGSAAGGALSTLDDMLRFARGLRAGRVVRPETLADLTKAKNAGLPDAPMPYGYGFILERTRDGVRSFGHGGIARGVNFELRVFPDLDLTLVAFSNQDNGAYDDLRRNAIRLITGER